MSENKTLGKIYNDAWDAANGNMAAVACAAVARHVFTTMMAEREPDKPAPDNFADSVNQVPKPEAGDWAMEAWTGAHAEWGKPMGTYATSASIIREAAERHYVNLRAAMNQSQAMNRRLIQERDAALAEVERLRAELIKLGASKPAAPPSPAADADATGEDELRLAISEAAKDNLHGLHITGDGFDAAHPMHIHRITERIRPLFDAVRRERDEAKFTRDLAMKLDRAWFLRYCGFSDEYRKARDNAEVATAARRFIKEIESIEDSGVKVLDELQQRAEAAEAELAKRPDERSCLAALMAIGDSLGLTGIVNPTHAVGGVEKMKAEREKLRKAIVDHRSQKADDRCIEDDDRLYESLGDGIKCDRRVGSKSEMMNNCIRFITNRCEAGGPWKSYVDLEAELDIAQSNAAELGNSLLAMTDERDKWFKQHDALEDKWNSFYRRVGGYLSRLKKSFGITGDLSDEAIVDGAIAERDKLAAELAEVREANAWVTTRRNSIFLTANLQYGCGHVIRETPLDAILAAYRSTKGKEQADGPK